MAMNEVSRLKKRMSKAGIAPARTGSDSSKVSAVDEGSPGEGAQEGKRLVDPDSVVSRDCGG